MNKLETYQEKTIDDLFERVVENANLINNNVAAALLAYARSERETKGPGVISIEVRNDTLFDIQYLPMTKINDELKKWINDSFDPPDPSHEFIYLMNQSGNHRYFAKRIVYDVKSHEK